MSMALAMMQRSEPVSMSESRLMAMPIERLRAVAWQEHPEHDDGAARVFVRRILDMEAQRRTEYADDRLQGYGGSPIAPGFAPGSTDIAREPLATLYDRGIRCHKSHDAVRQWIVSARIPPRQLLAALIQARKLHPRKIGPGSDWQRGYDYIAAHGTHYAQLMGWPSEFGRGLYKDGQAVKDAAKAAKAQLILLARAGV